MVIIQVILCLQFNVPSIVSYAVLVYLAVVTAGEVLCLIDSQLGICCWLPMFVTLNAQ